MSSAIEEVTFKNGQEVDIDREWILQKFDFETFQVLASLMILACPPLAQELPPGGGMVLSMIFSGHFPQDIFAVTVSRHR